MTQSKTKLNCYQKSLQVMKENIIGVLSVTMFFLSCVTFLVMVSNGLRALLGRNLFQFAFLKSQPFVAIPLTTGFLLLLIFVLLPIILGAKRWFYRLSEDERTPLSELFYYFSGRANYWRAVSFSVQYALRQALAYIVCMLPGFALVTMLSRDIPFKNVAQEVLYSILVVIGVLAMFGGFLLAFYYNLRYFAATYLFFEYPLLRPSKALSDSVILMKRRKKEVVTLYISLFPFYLLSILILPVLFLMPYLQVLLAVKGRELLDSANLHYPRNL